MGGSEHNDPRLPHNWTDWVIEEKLGEGSYGAVYRASRKIGSETVYSAIKIIRIPEGDEEIREMARLLGKSDSVREYYKDLVDGYVQEIQMMERLKGITNIVSIQDYEVESEEEKIGWLIFIRMELLTSFTDYQVDHKMGVSDVIRLGMDIATALEYCEKIKIVHRDLKPDNIFVSEMGNFKLGDFGVARKLDRSLSVYSSRGTYSYMAPEVYMGKKYDHRADIYSLGLVMYRLLNNNREPFLPADQQMIYYKNREEALQRRMDGEEIPRPAGVPDDVWKVLRKSIAFDMNDRYENAAEFKKALSSLTEEKPTEAVKEKKVNKAGRFTAAVIVIILAAIAAWFILQKRDNSPSGNDVAFIPETETVSEMTAAAEIRLEETETEMTAAETEIITETETESHSETESETETESHSETESETETDSHSETESEAETENASEEIEVIMETTETDSETETNAESEIATVHTEKGESISEQGTKTVTIDISEYAGFVISKEDKVVEWVNAVKLESILDETIDDAENNEDVRYLIDNFKVHQFSTSGEVADLQKGEIITMRFTPTEEYREALDRLNIDFYFKGKSKAYQGE